LVSRFEPLFFVEIINICFTEFNEFATMVKYFPSGDNEGITEVTLSCLLIILVVSELFTEIAYKSKSP